MLRTRPDKLKHVLRSECRTCFSLSSQWFHGSRRRRVSGADSSARNSRPHQSFLCGLRHLCDLKTTGERGARSCPTSPFLRSSLCLRASPVTSLDPFVFSGRCSCFRRIKSESRRPRRRIKSRLCALRLLCALRCFSFSAPPRLGGEFCVGQLPRSIKADASRRWSSVVQNLASEFQTCLVRAPSGGFFPDLLSWRVPK